MRIPLVYKITAPVLLAVFTLTSCNYFTVPQPDTISVPIGKGDIRFVYLDNDYKPTTTDSGKTAMYVENNELATDVLVLAEIRDNNIDNDVVVRVINKQNNSLVSFFYHNGKDFPYKVAITIDGQDITGEFSMYDVIEEKYSVEFTYDNNKTEKYKNFILNKNVFSLHKNDDRLSDTQNTRASCILTTLALWTSLSLQLDDTFVVGGRWNFWHTLSVVFAAVAVIAVVVVCILAPPAAIAVAGVTLTVSLSTTPALIAGGVAVGSAVAAMVTYAIGEDLELSESQKNPAANENRRPSIMITLDGAALQNNQMPAYYLKKEESSPGESLTFDVKITDKAGRTFKDIIPNEFCRWFDPASSKYIDPEKYNAAYFDVEAPIDSSDSDVIHLKVTRKETGYYGDGRVQLALIFRMDVSINGTGGGIDFWSYPSNEQAHRKDIFVLNFTPKDT
ncbi:MAG: hypothetical protein LBU85_07885 [Treponema sp.]|jgi:hypothetical protein|nr:hypothetical protein [Treponema sp.]